MAGYTLVIPAWNDGYRVAQTLKRYLPVFDASKVPIEIIIVSDGNYNDLERAVAPFRKRVKVQHHPRRLGKGGAIMAGFCAAGYDRVGFVDSDGPVPPEEVLAMFDDLSSNCCVIASRRLPQSRVVSPQAFSRRLLGKTWSLLVRGLFLLPIRDTQCGAKFFRKECVDEVSPKVAVASWAFDVSLLFHLREAGFTLKEYPVTWADEGSSKLEVATDVPQMLITLLGVRAMNLPLRRLVPNKWIRSFTAHLSEP